MDYERRARSLEEKEDWLGAAAAWKLAAAETRNKLKRAQYNDAAAICRFWMRLLLRKGKTTGPEPFRPCDTCGNDEPEKRQVRLVLSTNQRRERCLACGSWSGREIE